MRKYMYTILLCISCFIALPFITKKVFKLPGGEKIIEEITEKELEDKKEPEGEKKSEDKKEPEGKEESEDKKEPEGKEKSEDKKEPEGEKKLEDKKEPEGKEESEDKKKPKGKKKPAKKRKFTKVERDYFKDALFIGDSRTVGLSEYADLNGAQVFADTGMSVYKIHDKTIDVKGVGKTTLKQLLKNQKYGKIYVMLGINELGYDSRQTVQKFGELIEEIQAWQPDSVIFIGANLHVTESKSASSDIYNNKNINRFNKGIKKLADGKDIFYIDVNEIFDDSKGNLDIKYTVDESHVLGKYYSDWADWILEKGIVK